jgi:L-seryl-tRNA(Ser) seleniumtransferase
MKPNRRDTLRATLLAAAAGTAKAAPPATAGTDASVYTRIGVRPFINLTATYTINGGTLTLPEVKKAMDDASHFSVNLDELMEKAGERIATLLGVEAAIVTSGAAAALTCATSAAVAGGDPERMHHLPDMRWFEKQGLPFEVMMAKESRNAYDHAIRSTGVKFIEYSTREEFHAALSKRTALVAVLGTAEAKGKMRLEEIAEAAHKLGVPVLVDGAAELPLKPNPFLSRGADMVAYSGGKILRGPQCAGLLLGRKDLIRAAWMNSAPHHGQGRAMKVGKEEVMGMVAAIEVWATTRDLKAEYRTWESWFAEISAAVTKVPGVKTKVNPPAGASPFPVMEIAWDPERVGITAGDIYDLLINGEPRIQSHASGDGFSFIVRPVSMKPEHVKPVARRFHEILASAPKGLKKKSLAAPAADLTGRWKAAVKFSYGDAEHTLDIAASGHQLTGTHKGRAATGKLTGSIDGNRVKLRSSMMGYEFDGTLSGGRFAGTVSLGEYGAAQFTAEKENA